MYYKEFNILRGIAILLVVIGHSFPDNFNGSEVYKYIHKFIYSFHMPVFFFISGFFSLKIFNDKFIYKDFIKEKFKRIVVPYISFSLMASVIIVVISHFFNDNINFRNIIYGIFINPYENPMMSLWYIYTLFMIFIFVATFRNQNIKTMIYITVLMAILPLGSVFNAFTIKSICRNILYFYIGIIARKNYRYIKNYLDKKQTNLIIIVLIINLLLLNLVNSSELVSKFIFIATSFIGIIVLLIISYKIRYNMLGNIFEILGKYSFDIYLTSWFSQMTASVISLQVLDINYNYAVILIIISGILPIVIMKPLLNKFKIYRVIVGENYN